MGLQYSAFLQKRLMLYELVDPYNRKELPSVPLKTIKIFVCHLLPEKYYSLLLKNHCFPQYEFEKPRNVLLKLSFSTVVMGPKVWTAGVDFYLSHSEDAVQKKETCLFGAPKASGAHCAPFWKPCSSCTKGLLFLSFWKLVTSQFGLYGNRLSILR